MRRFRDFFRRSNKHSKQEQKHSIHYAKQYEAVPDSLNIASMPVAGMQRSSQGTVITSYTSTQSTPALREEDAFSSSMSDTSKTAVDPTFTSKHGESQWKGKPIGHAYDKREELTPEDEDMWAKLAM